MHTPTPPPTFSSLQLGALEIWPPVVLAPMAGVTNAAFRELCQRHGAGLYVNEMITARAFVERNPKTQRMLEFSPSEKIKSVQLYGIDAATVGTAVKRLVHDTGVDHIDLNFGCPAPKVTRNGGGAALPVRHKLLASIIGAAVTNAGDIPVTAKFRMGIDADHLTFLRTGRIAQEQGCAAIALHARTAYELYSGHAHWEAIGELKAAITHIPVLGNGDIWHAPDAIRMMQQTGCDGVVIGRGCLGRPWLFGELADLFNGESTRSRPTFEEVRTTMLEHFDLLVAWAGPHLGPREFRKHTGWYLKGYPVGSEMRARLHQITSREDLEVLLSSIDPSIQLDPQAWKAKRGHVGGPKPVALPHGWYELADSEQGLDAAAESLTSGG